MCDPWSYLEEAEGKDEAVALHERDFSAHACLGGLPAR